MRVEYEGVVQQQPTYQHVGYTAAANSKLAASPEAMASLGLAGFALVVTLMLERNRERVSRALYILGGVAAVLVVVGGVALAATNGLVLAKYYDDPYQQTYHRMELGWKYLLGVAEDEGPYSHAIEELPVEPAFTTDVFRTGGWGGEIRYSETNRVVDAWGRHMAYQRLKEPTADGRTINVISAGVDGTFGTEDDIDLSADYGIASELGERYPTPQSYWTHLATRGR